MPRRAAIDIRAMLAFCETRISRAEIARQTNLSRAYVGRLADGERGARAGYEVVASIQKLYSRIADAETALPIGNK